PRPSGTPRTMSLTGSPCLGENDLFRGSTAYRLVDMPPRKLTCPAGHSWEHAADGDLPANLSEICPICTVARQESTMPPAVEEAPRLVEAPPLPSLSPGQVLAGFEILEELNRGGMGVIYKARQQGLKRLVALKVISPERLGQSDALRRFQREVQAAALLSHPNIVTVYSTDLTGTWPYLAMEYVPGIDLFRLVKQAGPLPIAVACGYIQQAAQGLQHAFEQGLVHRDIKPHNLMVTTPSSGPTSSAKMKNRIKILDFGLARVTTEAESGEQVSSSLTQAGQFLGTPDYMSPEQADDPRKVDIRSDLFSLGGTFYFLLTGKPPYPGTSLMQKLGRLFTELPPSVAARRPEVPAELDALIRKLMAREPAETLPAASQLNRSAGRFLAKEQAAPGSPAPACPATACPGHAPAHRSHPGRPCSHATGGAGSCQR